MVLCLISWSEPDYLGETNQKYKNPPILILERNTSKGAMYKNVYILIFKHHLLSCPSKYDMEDCF